MCLNIAAWLEEPKYPGFGYGLRRDVKDGDGSGEDKLLKPRYYFIPQNSDIHVYIVALFGRSHLPRFLDALALKWHGAVDTHKLTIPASRTDRLLVITRKLCLSTSFTSS